VSKRPKPTRAAARPRRSPCPIANTLDLIGDKWTLLIVRDLLFFGKRQYRDFAASPEGIPSNILADRLKRMEADPKINNPTWLYSTGAHAAGSKVNVAYIRYQGSSHISKADALAYLEWLDGGNVGDHRAVPKKEPETRTMFRATIIIEPRIEEVQVVRTTDQYVFLQHANRGEIRHNLSGNTDRYCETLEEAQGALLEMAEAAVARKEEWLEDARRVVLARQGYLNEARRQLDEVRAKWPGVSK